MSLPTISVPTHELIIPSTKKKVKYRPFLVKEEKILLMAMESGDTKSMLTAMVKIIQSCIEEKVDVNELAMFDIEYIFLQLRSKSVDEKAKVNFNCEKCQDEIPVSIDLTKVKIDDKDAVDNKIVLQDNVGIIMKYPNIKTAERFGEDGQISTKNTFELIINCIDSVFDEEGVYKASDYTNKELMQFVESLPQSAFEKIVKFFDNAPKLKHELNFACPKCKEEQKLVLEGLESFFE